MPGQSYVIAATHVSGFDPFVVTTALGWNTLHKLMPCRFITANVFFKKALLRPFLLRFGAYPAKEFGAYSHGLDASLALAEQGDTIVIFPQGQRTIDRSAPAKRGVSVLARHNSLIIPVHAIKQKSWGLPSYEIWTGPAFDGSDLTPDEIMDHIYGLAHEDRATLLA